MLLIIQQLSMGFVMHSATNAATSRHKLLPGLPFTPMPTRKNRMSKDDFIDSEEGSLESNEEDDDDDYDYDLEPAYAADVRGRPAGVVLEDLNWRVEKLRLEEANTRRFLKAGPRFLPYGECKKWVQAWGERWKSANEWYVCEVNLEVMKQLRF